MKAIPGVDVLLTITRLELLVTIWWWTYWLEDLSACGRVPCALRIILWLLKLRLFLMGIESGPLSWTVSEGNWTLTTVLDCRYWRLDLNHCLGTNQYTTITPEGVTVLNSYLFQLSMITHILSYHAEFRNLLNYWSQDYDYSRFVCCYGYGSSWISAPFPRNEWYVPVFLFVLLWWMPDIVKDLAALAHQSYGPVPSSRIYMYFQRIDMFKQSMRWCLIGVPYTIEMLQPRNSTQLLGSVWFYFWVHT